jgi:putative hemolysin
VLVGPLVAATLLGLGAERLFGALGVAVATAFEILVVFVLAEALPKSWAVRNSERAALFAAPIVAVVVGFWPVRMLSNALVRMAGALLKGRRREEGVSESELLALADVAAEEQVIETEERALIHSILEFGDTVVREVMVPRPDMRALDARLTVSEALGVALEAGFSRLPAYRDNIDDVVGVAYVRDLVRLERAGRGHEQLAAHLRPARFVPETKRVASLMREMQSEKFHLAIVVDEYGGTAGLVTLEDLIEELVGEIVDEFDVEEPPVVRLGEGSVSVSPRLAIDELEELVGAQLASGGSSTVGGLVFDLLGHVPSEGEAVEADGVRLVAERVEGRRIARVRVERLS